MRTKHRDILISGPPASRHAPERRKQQNLPTIFSRAGLAVYFFNVGNEPRQHIRYSLRSMQSVPKILCAVHPFRAPSYALKRQCRD